MKYVSIPIDNSIEIINIEPVFNNPLISKCQIKVLYLGENRNRSFIDKEAARKMAPSLRGCPIVGAWNEQTQDFEEHNRILEISGGKVKMAAGTQPYGFVDMAAKIWFQKFLEQGVEREYLMTEGWLWTGQFPEAQRVIEKGNNQSMELSQKYLDAFWTKDNNGKPQFFIINEAIIEKLCILGEDYQPCFEGATISQPIVQFSYDEEFQNQLFSMMNEIKDLIEGGAPMSTEEVKVVDPVVEESVADSAVEELATDTVLDNSVQTEDPKTEEVVDPTFAAKDKEEKCPKCGKSVSECTCEDEEECDDEKKKCKYSLEDIPEYVELLNKFSALEESFNTLKSTTDETIASLTAFKNNAEKEEKKAMIDSFYMLSDEDKKDVLDNIDTYSVDDIEAKLSVICVRNKVSFSLDNETVVKENDPITYSLESDVDTTPAWIKSLQSVAKDMNN